MKKNNHLFLRKTHRWLGVLIGIQFLFWTVSGIYFSWTNIDEIHGDFEKQSPSLLSADTTFVSPSFIITQLQKQKPVEKIISFKLINILNAPVYQLVYEDHHSSKHQSIQLADAKTGKFREALTEEEAIHLAAAHFNGAATLKSVNYITKVDEHHEYRENALPAYAVSFSNENKTTVYVASELGTVEKFRNHPWRWFDWLWMTHTMDYAGRDNFNNILLRIFSIMGLLTVLSGFTLFFYTFNSKKKKIIM